MEALFQPIRAWYQALRPQERAIVLAGSAIVGVALIYFLLLAPVSSVVAQRTARVERKQQDLMWMRSVAGQLQQLSASRPGASTGESLVVLIDRSARQAGLASALTGQSPNGEHGMRVRLENAAFDSVVLWLGQLQQQYGVGVESASIDRTTKPGIVTASLVLTRAAK
ncbi:MAG: type II secretion system protein M [Candidatus Obscuribacterales bacterium]|nr:type II secretion system protein M [Steroidobacteraceae bacterium]